MAFRATYNGGILESKGIGVGCIPTYYFFSGLALLSQGFFSTREIFGGTTTHTSQLVPYGR